MKAEKLYNVVMIDFNNLDAVVGEVVHEKLPLKEAERIARNLRIEHAHTVLVMTEEAGDANKD